MKRVMICILLLAFLIPGVVSGYDNNITIGIDKIGAHRVGPVDMLVLWERNICINWARNGFIITADEGLTVWFEEGAEYCDCSCCGGPWFIRYLSSVGDSLHPNRVSIELYYIPGVPYMMGVGPMEPCYHLFLNFEGVFGNIYVDSIYEEPYNWIWGCNDQNTYPNFNYDGSTHVIHYGSYSCGDTDKSGGISISDAVGIIRYVFIGGQTPDPIESGGCQLRRFVQCLRRDWDYQLYLRGRECPLRHRWRWRVGLLVPIPVCAVGNLFPTQSEFGWHALIYLGHVCLDQRHTHPALTS